MDAGDDDGGYITLDSKSYEDIFGADRVNGKYRFRNQLHPKLNNFKHNYEVALVSVSVLGKESYKKTTNNFTCNLIEPYQYGSGLCQIIRTNLMWIRDYDAVDLHNVVPENIYTFTTLHYYRLRRGIFDNITISMEPMHQSNISKDHIFNVEHIIVRLHFRKIDIKEAHNVYML